MLAALRVVVIVQKLAGVLRRRGIDLFRQGANVLAGGSAVFRRALCTDGIERRHALFIGHRIAHALTAGTAHVVHADRRHGFDPVIDLRGAHRVAPAAADADDSDPVRIDRRVVRQEIDRRAEILDTHFGRFDPARIAAAFAVIRGIESQSNIAPLRQAAGVEPRGLLLHASERMADDDSGIFLGRIVIRREIKIADHVDAKAVSERDLPHLHSVLRRHGRRCGVGEQPFALQHFVQRHTSGIGFAAADPPFDDCQQVAQFIGCDSRVQGNAHVSLHHRLHASDSGQYRHRGDLPLGMGQHVALEKVGEEMLFEKHFDFGSQHGVIGFRRIRRDTGDLRENVASPFVFRASVGDRRRLAAPIHFDTGGLAPVEHADQSLQSAQSPRKSAVGVGVHHHLFQFVDGHAVVQPRSEGGFQSGEVAPSRQGGDRRDVLSFRVHSLFRFRGLCCGERSGAEHPHSQHVLFHGFFHYFRDFSVPPAL